MGIFIVNEYTFVWVSSSQDIYLFECFFIFY